MSPHTFPAGVATVTCVASNANGTASCSFTVTVTETEPPGITCPPDVVASALPGEGSAVVEFSDPEATDACSDVTVTCEPVSGSVFPIGTSTVACTARDSSGNTNLCSFAVTVEEAAPETHDLAIVRVVAPKVVTLSASRPTATKRVVVTIQNRSPHTEAFFDPAQLQNLVTLNVFSLDTNVCSDVATSFLERPPQRRLPFNLRSKQKVNVYFEVTFDCAVNSAKGPGQGDFYYVATVNHAAIDGVTVDTHPECDVCPRPPLESGVDPNPNGRIRDKG
jgi:PKD repeat protein